MDKVPRGADFCSRMVRPAQRLLGAPWLRNIVGQADGGIDFAQVFARREVALFDLSGVGTTNAKLLGSLLLLLIRGSGYFFIGHDGRAVQLRPFFFENGAIETPPREFPIGGRAVSGAMQGHSRVK